VPILPALRHSVDQRGAERAARLGQTVDDGEMLLARLVDDVAAPLAGAAGGGEFRLLAMELGSLAPADGEDDRAARRGRRRQQMQWAVTPRRHGIEPDRLVEVAEPDRLEVEDAAERAAAGYRVADEAEARPVGQHRHRRQMSAGGMAGKEDALAIDAKRRGLAREEGDRPPDLPDDLVHPGCRGEGVVDHCDAGPLAR
jgi:hypothetical protein